MTPALAHLMAEYNCRMNMQVYAAAAKLSRDDLLADKGAFFGSVLGTLNHLCVADIIWLRRFASSRFQFDALQGLAAFPSPTSLRQSLAPDLEGLRTFRFELDAMVVAWAKELTHEHLDSALTYRNMAGEKTSRSLGALVQHFFNHQTHHRGQISTLLYQCGVDVGVTDLLAVIPIVDA